MTVYTLCAVLTLNTGWSINVGSVYIVAKLHLMVCGTGSKQSCPRSLTVPQWQVYYFTESQYIQQSDSNGAHFLYPLDCRD